MYEKSGGMALFSLICYVWFRTKLPSITVADQIKTWEMCRINSGNRRNSEKINGELGKKLAAIVVAVTLVVKAWEKAHWNQLCAYIYIRIESR